MAERLQRAGAAMQRQREKWKEQTNAVVRTTECFAVGGLLGYLEGRYDRTELAGAPIAPVIGVSSHIAGFVFAKELGDDVSHLHAIGDACLAVHGAKMGKEIGADQKTKANNNQSTASNTQLPAAYQA